MSFFIIYGIILPIDELIFLMVKITTNQILYYQLSHWAKNRGGDHGYRTTSEKSGGNHNFRPFFHRPRSVSGELQRNSSAGQRESFHPTDAAAECTLATWGLWGADDDRSQGIRINMK